MKEIILSRDLIAKVDDEDFEMLSCYKWSATKSRNIFYACRATSRSVGRKIVLMHREILHLTNLSTVHIDHIDGDGLNNQKYNLRVCTIAENNRNKKAQANNHFGYKGVSWHKENKKFRVRIQVNNKQIYLGCYNTVEDAARAYDVAAIKLHGEFANLNFPIIK